jgi:hypothetical protein
MGGNPFDELAGPSGEDPHPRSAADLAAEITSALDEEAGRVRIEPDDREMAWLVRDGRRLSWFNLTEAERLNADRRATLVRSFRDLVRRIDELWPTIEGLEVGRSYAVEYTNPGIRRTFRVKAALRSVSEFRPGRGVSGAGWTLRFESRPRFGAPGTFEIDSSTLVRIEPA